MLIRKSTATLLNFLIFSEKQIDQTCLNCDIYAHCFNLSGALFRRLIDERLRDGFHKGVPPLFMTLKSVYKDSLKVNSFSRNMNYLPDVGILGLSNFRAFAYSKSNEA